MKQYVIGPRKEIAPTGVGLTQDARLFIAGLPDGCTVTTRTGEIELQPEYAIVVRADKITCILAHQSPVLLLQLPPGLSPDFADSTPLALDPVSQSVLMDVFLEHTRSEEHERSALQFVAFQGDNVPKTEITLSTTTLPTPADRIELYLKERLDENVTLSELKQQFQCSTSHLIRKLAEAGKPSPMQFFAQMKIHRARELLRSTDLTISQIGAELGMTSLSTFSHFFQRQTGQSPSQYRKNVRWLL